MKAYVHHNDWLFKLEESANKYLTKILLLNINIYLSKSIINLFKDKYK